MPVGLDVIALHRHFSQHLPGYNGGLNARLVSGGKSNLTYRLSDGVHDWVLRRPPLGPLTPSAHDMVREYRVMDALQDTPVPVPGTRLLCRDESVLGVPFLVVDYVEGRTLRSHAELGALSSADQAALGDELADRLAALHRVDPIAVGLADFGRPAGYLGRQLRRWSDQWSRVRTRESADFERLAVLLADALPQESGATIVHGDYRIDNVLVAPDAPRIEAIVDWELSTLGDPLADLAMTLVYWEPLTEPVLGVPHVRGGPNALPSPAAFLDRYARGRDLPDLEPYLALAALKLAVIAEGIHSRFLAGSTVGSGFETAGSAVEPLLAYGLGQLAPARAAR
ncbi:phosphotransferase family protein [Agromyces sp. SYSU T00194]|uniref:phosphotransferase family protein n=1 Tax=Agromyces chitinivorans TaxID=3158560 RepID=UPI003395E09D